MEGRAVFISKVEHGKTKHGPDIARALAALEGQRVKITVEKYRKTRSSNQNQYYWGVVIRYIQAILNRDSPGTTPQQAHEFCRLEDVGKLTDYKVISVTEVDFASGLPVQVNYVITHLKSTTKLTTLEFEAYLERVRQWALKAAGVIIPLPNEDIDQYYVEPKDI